jgi:hypothetical protein
MSQYNKTIDAVALLTEEQFRVTQKKWDREGRYRSASK